MQKYMTRKNVVAAIAVGLGLLGIGAYEFGGSAAKAVVGPSITPIVQAEMTKGTQKEVTVEYTVAGGIAKPEWKGTILNSNSDYKAADNLTVYVSKTVPGFDDPKALVGNTYLVTGVVSDYKGKGEIKVTDPKCIVKK